MNRKPKLALDLQTNRERIMAKLTVKNVGPIRDAEFEVKKHTVFIGPQGSGKSTLAKLIAVCSDKDLFPTLGTGTQVLLNKYNIVGYHTQDSYVQYEEHNYHLNIGGNEYDLNIFPYVKNKNINAQKISSVSNSIATYLQKMLETESGQIDSELEVDLPDQLTVMIDLLKALKDDHYNNVIKQVIEYDSIYIPSERNLTAILSNAVWSLLYSDISLPKAITLFGRQFEEARNAQDQFSIPFLQIKYERKNGQDFIEYQLGQSVNLAQSASGYQSTVPLLLVVEYQRRQSLHRFIIEEPELNLYPIAQKDLIYSLMSGLDPNIEYQDAEWVITTHSPYVLTSLNTLMLAYKVAQKSVELRAEVEKLVPVRCWINPDEFAAYYVDNGTVESITNPETGLINDSRLDDVSEDFAGEQDTLFNLYRTARVND